MVFNKKINNSRNKIISIDKSRSNDNNNKNIYKKIHNNNKKIILSKEKNKLKNKIIPIYPYKKITIIKNKPMLKKIDFKEILKNLNNNQNNNKYHSNLSRTHINNEDTTQTSDKEIYRNISFEIKKEKLIKNNEKINNELNIKKSSKKEEDDVSIQSLSDSKVLEIAKTYVKLYNKKWL